MTVEQMKRKSAGEILKIQYYTRQVRRPVLCVIYGCILVFLGIIMIIVDPLENITNWFLEMEEGSFLYNMWEEPTYQLFSEVWIFNYTNVPEFMRGEESVLKVKDIGPFTFRETRLNNNITIDRERGVMSMVPNTSISFLREKSIADTKDVTVYVPNIAVLALSTLAADKLNYFANTAIYYSMNALSSTLFRSLTADEFLWGYDDPLVTIASSVLPGWIDFTKLGILDRFYASKTIVTELELNDPYTKFSIKKWDESEGLKEQGFSDINTSLPCNRIKGTYEGFMLPPKFSKDRVIPLFRKQACRVYPFIFQEEVKDNYDFSYFRFAMEQSAFNKISPYACECTENCLPDGFVDVSNCYYGFPIALSKPHFLDVDPVHSNNFEGMKADPQKHNSLFDMEPTVGVPIKLSCNIQVNIAVRMSSANTITKPVKDKVLPLLWVSMYCKMPPPEILMLLKMRLVIAPKLIVFIEVLLFAFGFVLGVHGSYRMWRPRVTLVCRELENIQINEYTKNFENDIEKQVPFQEENCLTQLISR